MIIYAVIINQLLDNMENLKDGKKPANYFNQSRKEMLNYVPKDAKRVLDIGCGKGIFSQLLKENTGAETWGVEMDKESAQLAANRMDKVLVGDIMTLLEEIPDNYFDCLVFNDVLEHLSDPNMLLEKMKNKLSDDGVIISSLPNVRYFFNLYELLFKRDWRYTDAGILDRTHLRFFTKKSIIRMFEELGYEVVSIRGINSLRAWKFFPINIMTLGFINDSRYLQYATVARIKK